jgi:ankyrin repeat protein
MGLFFLNADKGLFSSCTLCESLPPLSFQSTVAALIRTGADIHAMDALGNTALSEAIKYGHDDVVELLYGSDAR